MSPAELAAIAPSVAERHVSALPAGFGGMALPGVALFAHDPDPSLWAHEMAHQVQMRRDGVPRFALRYVGEWYGGRMHGCSPMEAYESVGYELDAAASARALPLVTEFAWSASREEFIAALENPDRINVWQRFIGSLLSAVHSSQQRSALDPPTARRRASHTPAPVHLHHHEPSLPEAL